MYTGEMATLQATPANLHLLKPQDNDTILVGPGNYTQPRYTFAAKNLDLIVPKDNCGDAVFIDTLWRILASASGFHATGGKHRGSPIAANGDRDSCIWNSAPNCVIESDYVEDVKHSAVYQDGPTASIIYKNSHHLRVGRDIGVVWGLGYHYDHNVYLHDGTGVVQDCVFDSTSGYLVQAYPSPTHVTCVGVVGKGFYRGGSIAAGVRSGGSYSTCDFANGQECGVRSLSDNDGNGQLTVDSATKLAPNHGNPHQGFTRWN